MRKANVKNVNASLYRRLAEVRMTEHDRQRAAQAIRDAEVIADGVIWLKDRIASLGAMLLRPAPKH